MTTTNFETTPSAPPRPEPCNLTKKEINNVAEYIATELEFNPGDELEPIVEFFGGSISYVDFTEWDRTDSASMVVMGPKDFTMYIARFTGLLRDRFSIAHELGHYVLHSQFGKIPCTVERFPPEGSDRLEWEANWFAAGFLMPSTDFEKSLKAGKSKLEMSSQFLVSEQAIHFRRKNLGL